MNIKARRITLGDTCVIDKIVVTHFRNPVVGMASGMSGVIGLVEGALSSSTACRVTEASNQKRQVT